MDVHTPTIGSDTPDEGKPASAENDDDTRDAVSESPSASTGCEASSHIEEEEAILPLRGKSLPAADHKAVEGTINWFEHPR